MKLDTDAITTREVLGWKGLHLLNNAQSSCSQKIRILLAEKGLPYQSREVDLKKLEHTTPWFLGINPRGVVPVLVDNGDVHIESNDILAYLEERYPSEQSWLPTNAAEQAEAQALLDTEAALHPQLRAITMGFLAPKKMMAKTEPELQAYLANGPDNDHRKAQVAWWRAFAENGISDSEARDAATAFRAVFVDLEQHLADRQWLLGDHPMLVDIAWFINIHRLVLAGYPIADHPRLAAYYQRLLQRPAFAREIAKGPFALRVAAPVYRFMRRVRGTDLGSVYAAST
ncbi:glutathione S-transferase family protein [Alterisphingorhabdus coralli]|uniref:Glutathione S-transferase family protein n=1 Tax=Alterisphingorhabdus coralli TaxID=3071408 RepID=A0AA97F923_9SPHN|nr:glutathione S-transferase family protein [Parasphingorhabdus sp. SCSIO 66989]WOE75533.1 glutathione S-transferase family protein [Parasphingorhabdus sp. SCSIO 66989]